MNPFDPENGTAGAGEDFGDQALTALELDYETELYWSRQLADHSLEQQGPEALFRLIEEEGFLVDQVENLGSYAEAGRTLGQLGLPHARGERFFRFAMTHLALQQLAARLDDEATARAILRVGRHDLVAGLADQLARPLDRARIWALLAAADRASDQSNLYCRQAIEAVGSFLDSPRSVLSDDDEACLRLIVYEMAGEVAGAWIHWQKSSLLSTERREKLRLAFLEGLWLRQGWLDRRGLDEALRCADLKPLAGSIAHLLVEQDRGRLGDAVEFLELWRHQDSASGWRLALLVGGRIPPGEGELACLFWERLTRSELPPQVLLDREALPFLWQLEPRHLYLLRRQTDAPAPRAMVALAVLHRQPLPENLETARAAVENLEEPRLRFFAVIFLAIAAAPVDRILARRWLRSAGDALEAAGYHTEVPLLTCYLKAVALLDGKLLHRELQEVTFAPGFKPDNLVELAGCLDDPAAFRVFLDGVEKFSLAVSENELAAFELRSRVLYRLGEVTLDMEGGFELLDSLTERQLLEEEEVLRLDLATRLLQSGRAMDARRLIERLPEGAHRRLAEIRLMAAGKEAPLDAAALFAALFDLSSIEDDLWGLRALLEPPLHLEETFEKIIARIVHPDTRSLFVLHLVQHRAAFERGMFGRLRDPRSLLEMARPLLVVEDQDRLAAVVPELVQIGLLAGRKVALAELLESAEGLVHLRGLDAQDLLEAFEQLILTAGRDPKSDLATPFFAALTRLPSLFEAQDREKIRLFRPLIPRIVAILEAASGSGAATTWLAKLGGGWRLHEEPWPEIVRFCREDMAARQSRSPAAAGPVEPAMADAAVLLLAGSAPQLALQWLASLPALMPRRRLAARLVRFRWLEPAHHAAALLFVDDQELQRSTLVHSHLGGDDPAFLENLADAVAHGHIDSRHPASQPILRRLWLCQPELSEAALQPATRRAFEEGPEAADRALRIWLHSRLAPRLGEELPIRLELWQELWDALQRARQLDYGAG